MTNKYVNITVSIIALSLILLITFKYCGKKTYTQADIDAINLANILKKQDYIDSLDFVRGQLDLQQERANAQQERADSLGKQIDALILKHDATKKMMSADLLHPVKFPFTNADTGFILAPNEYVKECEGCFDLLGKYKNQNAQLKFERDNYDTLMRQQNDISANMIKQLNKEIAEDKEMINACCGAAGRNSLSLQATRKVKISAIGMFSNPFLPKGGGFGLIYEDKRFNEYGSHVIFTGSGNIYMLNIAKTISFRRKK